MNAESAQKHNTKKAGRAARVLYIVLFLLLCVIPSAGLLFGADGGAQENAQSADLPSVRREDGTLNTEFLQQAGDWFQAHFAFRQEYVTANAMLRAALFQESAAERVIMGTDGWLYYRDSLADYQGTDLLSDRALYDIAHTAAMTQEYCGLLGIRYLFALAPNKATLYPEHMPYFVRHKASEQSNRSRLEAFMEAERVSYLDLAKTLEESAKEESPAITAEAAVGTELAVEETADVTESAVAAEGVDGTEAVDAAEAVGGRPNPGALYHKRDSHWTAQGAAIAADAILNRLEIPHRDYAKASYTVRKEFDGDLERMLFPAAAALEEDVFYEPAPAYGYTEPVESTFDFYIHTVSGGAGKSLVMYRDSFGNAILPFLAEAWETAFFSRGTPYTLTDLYECEASDAVFLRAERFLPEIAAVPPVLEAFPCADELQEEELSEAEAELTSAPEDANPYYSRIEGILKETPEPGERIYVDPGDGSLYEAMPLHRKDGKEGFLMYLPQERADQLGSVSSWRVYLSAG